MDVDKPVPRSGSRPTKRLKTSTPNAQNISQNPGNATRKRPSKLANLPRMPIDILFEIFGRLHPYDLLKLSRTNKDFRRFLTSKSSITVWKDSLSTVLGLPECPPGMCEIAWTNLVFSPHCHLCLCTGVRNIEWVFRLRICSKCAKEHLQDIETMLIVHGPVYDPQIYRDFENILIQKTAKGRHLYLQSDFDNVLEDFRSIPDTDLFSESIPWQDYISNRKKSNELIYEHANRCQSWERSQVQDRESELRQLREDRINAIKDKLISMGWERDLASMRYDDTLSTNKLANRPQRLTERVWTNIKAGILEHMEKVRARRLKREYEKLVSDRRLLSLQILRDFKRSKLADNLVMPKPADFFEFPPIKEITEMPADIEITLSSFEGVIPKLPELVNNWRDDMERMCANVLKEAQDSESWEDYDEDDDFTSFFMTRKMVSPFAGLSEEELLQKAKLASTVYECRTCKFGEDDDDDYGMHWGYSGYNNHEPYSKPLFYPHVLGHQCQHNRTYLWYWDLDRLNMPEETTVKNLKRLIATTSKPAESVIMLAGLDPATATADDMDKLDLRFVCNKCPISSGIPKSKDDATKDEDCLRLLFDWRTAIRHKADVHFSSDQIYTKLGKDELDDEILIEESEHRLQNNREWRCIHCIDLEFKNLPMTFDQIKNHFAHKHPELPPPVVDESCFRDYAAPNIHCIQSVFKIRSKNGHYSVHTGDSDDEQDFYTDYDEDEF